MLMTDGVVENVDASDSLRGPSSAELRQRRTVLSVRERGDQVGGGSTGLRGEDSSAAVQAGAQGTVSSGAVLG